MPPRFGRLLQFPRGAPREGLFDANTPAPLAAFLRGHDVVRADELGWQGLENGALLDAAERAAFDLLGQIVKLDVAQL